MSEFQKPLSDKGREEWGMIFHRAVVQHVPECEREWWWKLDEESQKRDKDTSVSK